MPKRSFEKVFQESSQETINSVARLLQPKSAEISQQFYTVMLEMQESQIYLQNEVVEKQLSRSFEEWAHKLFCESANFDSNRLADYHLAIGKVHARIGIPMRLVDYGMQIVKDYCFRAYLEENQHSKQVPSAIIFINNLLDTALTTINQSYFESTIDNERNAQLLRLKMASSDLNVECERVKSDLLTWSRDLLSYLLSKSNKSYEAIANIYQTNFGLWISHKAVFYFSDYEEFGKIKESLFKLDQICLEGKTLAFEEENQKLVEFMNNINAVVNEIAWLLSQIIERNTKENQSKDPLTNMLSRRYIDSILKREVEISLKQHQKFSVLMVDLDNFKTINDTYGHATGDSVLKEVAHIILQCVRPTDFSFRYGGEEFLVVLTNMNTATTSTKAENIRRSIENTTFFDKSGKQVPVTASIGAAVHDGHPDYQKTLDIADSYLYRAKNEGKNKVVM